MDSSDVIGLIAGEGRLPFLVASGARHEGKRVICVGLAGNADLSRRSKAKTEAALAGDVDVFYTVAIARPGSWLRKLKKHGVTRAIMAGRIAKQRIFTPWRIARYLPDWRALRIWYWRLRDKDKRNDTLLCALADELACAGIVLEDTTMYCKEHLATKGPMAGGQPPSQVKGDIEFGWEIVKKLGELDIGQAIAVKEKEVLAVEAIEGTAKLIERAGQICKSGGWTLIKAAKPNQDLRFDVPCVGPDTIKGMAENGGKFLVVEAGKVIIIDKPETLKLAEELGITVLGR
jgi:hypothetical protein